MADLLRIQGEGSFYPPEIAKKALLPLLKSCQPNGLTATEEQKSEINSLVMTLEASNPTVGEDDCSHG